MFVGIVDAFRSMIGAFSFDISPVSYDACKRLRVYTLHNSKKAVTAD